VLFAVKTSGLPPVILPFEQLLSKLILSVNELLNKTEIPGLRTLSVFRTVQTLKFEDLHSLHLHSAALKFL